MSARGRHPHHKLNAAHLRKFPPGRYADGGGLYLYVRHNGKAQWVQRITIHGRRRDLGLGPYPLVSLADARNAALDNRRIVRAGGDPTLETAWKTGPTFRRVYELATEIRRKSWDTPTTEASWRRGFEKYVFPAIGGKPVAAVTLADVSDIVVPYWKGPQLHGLHPAAEHRVRPALCRRRKAPDRQSGC